MIFLIVVIFAILALADFPKLIKDKKWREAAILGVFYAGTFTLAALQAYDVTLFSPIKMFQKLITDVLHLGYPQQ